MPTTAEILQRGQRTLIANYARVPVAMVRGEGSWVWDADGRRYLDLFAGFGGDILGHCHPELISAATAQARQLWHVGNSFWTEAQIDVAERLNRVAFAGQAFFCHSGLEANEAACKLARLRGNQQTPRRWRIISLTRSFHGRSLAMIAATGNPAIKAGFEPVVEGFINVEAGDFAALEKAVDDQTCGIILELIQGEGGMNLYPEQYIRDIRRLCDQRGLTLIFDEVWTGFARTGRWFAYQHYGVEPDIMTLGKAAGGGLPVGIMYAKSPVAALFGPGKHGCTLGGNAICMAVCRTIMDVIERDRLVEQAALLGNAAIKRLQGDSRLKGKVTDVRGKGLMLGIELAASPGTGDAFLMKALNAGLVLNLTAQKVIRLAPPVNIDAFCWDEGLDRVVELIASVSP